MLSRLARRVPSHCASDIAASGTSSGGQTPWFTTRMSSPPSARAASSTARLAPPGSPRSAWTATVSFRPLPPPTALIVSSASAFLLRYPTATLAPARASSSAVARPIPRPPPVTNARFPERSITTPPQRGSRNSKRGTDGPISLRAFRVPRSHFRVSNVPRSDFRVPRSDGQPLLHHLTHHVLDGEVQLLDPRRVIGRHDQRHVGQLGEVAAALAEQGDDGVAGEEQRPARAQRDLVALRDGGDGGPVLRRHSAGERGERFEPLARPLLPAHGVIP